MVTEATGEEQPTPTPDALPQENAAEPEAESAAGLAPESPAEPILPTDTSEPVSCVKAVGCLLVASSAILVPIVVAIILLLQQFETDGDQPRELGEDVLHVSVGSPDSVISSVTMYVGMPGEPLEFGSDSSGVQSLYLRFPIELPPELDIASADIVFRSDSAMDGRGTGATTAVIELLDTDDQPPFARGIYSSAHELRRIEVVEEGAVSWDVDPWVVGENYATPDISHLIETFLRRPGYRPRSSIGLRIRGEGAASTRSQDHAELRSVATFGTGNSPFLRIVVAGDEPQ